jgi:uncharacterized protein YjbJ (UPF0337 family)
MNELKIKGNWNQIKGKLKQRYAELTDDDLQYVEGREEELLGKLREKTGERQDELVKIINSIGER